MSSYHSLAGRPVLVTGASRGLGRAMALGLLKAGARVAIASTGPSKPLDETLRLADLVAPASQRLSIFGDLREPDDCARIVREVEAAFGRVDVLVNNAAIPNNGAGPFFYDIPTDAWRRVARTNCDTVFFMSRALAPAMLSRRFGKIINVSTSDRTMVRPGYSPYGPTKAFVEACTRMWAEELASSGVTMNALSPGGAVDTAADVTGAPAAGGRYLSADVMNDALLWLAADESNAVTGHRFVGSLWDEALPLDERVARARQSGAPEPRIM